MQSGFELKHLGSRSKVSDFSADYSFEYIEDGNQTSVFGYHYDLLEHKERQRFAYLNVPLMVGLKFNRYYAMLGAKAGLNIFGNYKTTTSALITAKDPIAPDEFENMGNHGLTKTPLTQKGKLDLGFNLGASAEFGVILDEWLPEGMKSLNNARRTPISYRLGVFADYGLLNINNAATNPAFFSVAENAPSEVFVSGLSTSLLAKEKDFRDFYTGLKLTVSFQANQEQKRRTPSRSKTAPPPKFYAEVSDAETGNSLKATVIARTSPGNRVVFNKNTNAEGKMSNILRKGKYVISAKANGYSEFKDTIVISQDDSLHIILKRIPLFFVRVIDRETKQNVQANVQLLSSANNQPIFNQTTDAVNGIISRALDAGKYQIEVSAEGYISQKEFVEFTSTDTLQIALQAIKKDTKVVLENLFFEFGKANIMPESEPTLKDLYQFLVDNPEVAIHIIGHTDNVGSASYNLNLSKNRAQAVYNDLIARGIDAKRLSFEGKGSEESITSNDSEEGRAKNRRVEFVIK